MSTEEVASRPPKTEYDWAKRPSLLKSLSNIISPVMQIVLAASIAGSFLFGFSLACLNTSLHSISGEFLWCKFEGYAGCKEFTLKAAFISTAVFIGAAVGAMSSGRALKYGARRVILVALTIVAFGSIFSVAAPNFTILLMGRLVCGLGVGIVAVAVPTYISEVTPSKSRGSYGVVHQLFITIGIFVGVLLGLALRQAPHVSDGARAPTPEQIAWSLTKFEKIWWRVMLAFAFIPIALGLLLFGVVYNFETPFNYVTHGHLDDAKNLLQRLTMKDDVTDELDAIQQQIDAAAAARQNGFTVTRAFGQWKYAKIILIGCLISAFQQLSGINVFITSSNRLFEDAGLSSKLLTVMSVVLTLVNVLMALPPVWLIEIIGRKYLFLIGLCGMAVSVLPGAIMLWINQSLAATWVAISGAIGFIIFFSSTYGPVLWVYLFEMFPTEIKDVGSGLATAVNWLSGIAMVFIANFISTKISYTIFCVLNIVGFVMILFLAKETKGRTVGDSPYLNEYPKGENKEIVDKPAEATNPV